MTSPSPLAGEGRLGEAERAEGPTLSERAKQMRANPTEAEQRLWSMLRDRRLGAFKFRRQIVLPPYIADFVFFEQRLIVEADGSQHAECDYYRRLDAYLQREDFTVRRFWYNDILSNAQGVFEAIQSALTTLTTPHPARAARGSTLSRKGRGAGELHA